MAAHHRSQRFHRDLRYKPLNTVVRRMDLQHHAGLRSHGLGVVLKMRAVRGADLDQLGAGAAHDLRHPEGAADLDQLAARHDCFATLGKRVEHQEHGGGVVVDDSSVLGACQLTQEIAQNIVAIAAPAGAEIVFERNGAAHCNDRRRDRGLRHRCAAQIGVQHRAGEIVDGLEAWGVGGLKMRQRNCGSVARPDGETIAAQFRESLAHRVDDGLMPEPCRRHLRRRTPHHRIDRRQTAPVLCLRIRHSVSPSLPRRCA